MHPDSSALGTPRKLSRRQAIDPDRSVAIELPDLALAGTRYDLVEDLDPGRIRMGQLRHGPVAAVHHAVETEAVDRMRDVRLHLFLGPRAVVGLGDHTRYLAHHVRQLREFAHLAPPRFAQAVLDAGLADVVEHERHVRTAPCQLETEDERPMLHADIEAQAVL